MALLKVDNKLAIAIVFVAAICGLAQCVRVEVNNFILIGFHARSWTFPQYVFGHRRRKCEFLLGRFKFEKTSSNEVKMQENVRIYIEWMVRIRRALKSYQIIW